MALCLDDDNDKTHSHNTKHQNSLLVGDPYGAVLWPASSAVANHLLNEFIHSSSSSSSLNSKDKLSILELGAGTGLISIAAAISGRFGHILATDYERIPLDLLEYAANHLNQGLDIHDDDDNDVLKKCERLNSIQTDLFDICNHDIPLPPADIVVAADIMYEPKTGRAMAVRAVEALRRGSRVIVGCSPGRPGRLSFHEEMKRLLPNMKIEFKDTVGQTCSGPRHELICGKGSESISAIPKELSVALMDLHCLEENESFT
jgi:predicted nicotinamide N-methyase